MIAEVPTVTEKDFLTSTFPADEQMAASGAFLLIPGKEKVILGAVPDELLYAESVHPQLRTAKPFGVRFERTEAGYAAVVSELDEYGVGATRSEALEDLRHTLRELYLSLEQNEKRLSTELQSVWTELRTHLVPNGR